MPRPPSQESRQNLSDINESGRQRRVSTEHTGLSNDSLAPREVLSAQVDNISVQAITLQQAGRPFSEKLFQYAGRGNAPHYREDRSKRKGVRHFLIFLKGKLWKWVWPNLILSHLDVDSLKVVFRTWAVLWVLMLFQILPKVGNFMGPSSFLGDFSSCIEICGGQSVTHAFLVCMIDLITVMFAFAGAAITTGINWHLRGYPSRDSVIRELAELGICKIGDEDCLLKEIQHGRYLRTQNTCVTVFGMLFTLSILGYVQTRHKLATLSWTLCSLASVIFFTFNNLVPYFDIWIFGRNGVVPMGISFATRFVFSVIIFPTTSNRKYVKTLTKVSKACADLLGDILTLEKEKKPSDADFGISYHFINERTQSSYAGFAAAELDDLIAQVEIAYSRIDCEDLREIRSLLRLVVSAYAGFRAFFSETEEQKERIIRKNTETKLHDSPTFSDDGPQYAVLQPKWNSWIKRQLSKKYKASGHFELTRQLLVNQETSEATTVINSTRSSLQNSRRTDTSVAPDSTQPSEPTGSSSESVHGINEDPNFQSKPKPRKTGKNNDKYVEMSMDNLDLSYLAILDRYKVIVEASHELLIEVTTWLAEANRYRLLRGFSPILKKRAARTQRERSEKLIAALDKTILTMERVSTSQAWMEPLFEAIQVSDSNRNVLLSLDSLYGFAARQYGKRVSELARHCMFLDHLRPKPVWILPWFIHRPTSKLQNLELEYVVGGIFQDIDAPDHKVTSFQPPSAVQARDPDSSPPRNVLHLGGKVLLKLLDLASDPDILFCIKRAGLNVVCLIPYFTKTTVHIAFANWWLWVSVLQGYTIARHAVDGLYGFLAKMVYTFFAAIWGMVAWYISTGNGHGNHYGFAIVMAFMYMYISYIRHFNNHSIPAASIVFSCTIILVTGNSWNSTHVSLYGLDLGYGFRVAWIRFVTVTIGIFISFLGTLMPYPYTAKKAIREIVGNCFELLGDVQASVSNFAVQRYNKPEVRIIAREDVITSKVRAIIANLATAEVLRGRLDFEPPLAGLYPRFRYKLLIRFGNELAQLYALMHYLMDEISDTKKIPVLLQRVGWTEPELTAGVYSLMYMSCQALNGGKALPSVTAAHLTEVFSNYTSDFTNSTRRASTLGFDHFGSSGYPDRDSQLTLTAITLAMQIYERIDAVVILVKSLVGEVYDVDISVYDMQAKRNMEDYSALTRLATMSDSHFERAS